MGFKRMSYSELCPSNFFTAQARSAIYKMVTQNLGGNMWGDGWQKGGCMVVGQEGNQVLMYYLQEEAADHANNEDIIKALNDQ